MFDPSFGLSREICKICYRPSAVGFTVPDAVWNQVVPEQLRERVLCIGCFARLADEMLVPWDHEIEFFPVSFATHCGVSALECPLFSR